MKQTLQLKLTQHLTLTPQLQQSIRLLQLSTMELNQELERFLAENPLLERDEGEEERLQDLDDLLPARFRRSSLRILAFAFGKRPRDLDVEVVLHPHRQPG